MNLEQGLDGMFDAQGKLQTAQATSAPLLMSKEMYRLAQYTGAVENILAAYERDYEIEFAQKLNQFIMQDGMKPSPASTQVDMLMGEQKGQIKYLTRVVSSSWKRVGVCQSRISHLIKESTTQI